MLSPQHIPPELKAIPQWVVWRREEQGATIGKPAYSARVPDERAWPNEPDTWAPFDVALECYVSHGDWFDGIAIVITLDLAIVGIDLDHTSEWPEDAQRIVDRIDSYTELSPSGDGYRIFCYALKPDGRCRRDNVEMYGSGRIFSVTGDIVGARRSLDVRQDAVDDVHAEFLEG